MKINQINYIYKFYNLTEKLLRIPPILIGGYILNKTTNNSIIDINYDKLNLFYDTLTKDVINSLSLTTTLTGSFLIGNKNAKARIIGSGLLFVNNLYFIKEALQHNPEPIFITQMTIFSYLSIKTIINETKKLNGNEQQKTNKIKLNNKIVKFLKNKKNAIKNGLNRFNIYTKNNPELLSSAFILLTAYTLNKYNINFDTIKNTLDIISNKVPEIVAITTAVLGVNEISKGKLFKAGNYFLISNMAWMVKPNSELQQLLSVLYTYTAALTAKNGLEMLNKDNKTTKNFISKIDNLTKKIKRKELITNKINNNIEL